MASVRSDRLASGAATQGITRTLFTVPPAETWLLKSLYLATSSTIAATCFFQVQIPPAGPVNFYTLPVPAAGGARWDGWIAFDPGAIFRLYIDGNNVTNYYASGAKLPGAAPDAGTTRPT